MRPAALIFMLPIAVLLACATDDGAARPPTGNRDVWADAAAPADAEEADAHADAPSRPPPSAEYARLYEDIFSIYGVARCQNPRCHGGDDGSAGLSMGADAYDLYQALTTYQYQGKTIVVPRSDRGDARAASALLPLLDPSTGVMPRVEPAVGNRQLTREELARLEKWLAAGGAY